ncbi:hypothetical protein GBN83_21300 [Bacillus sp. B3-WWTP-C-10-D-3]|nr:hypothetical protein GBN83_21300 [Bacillus sp. B3-WWTP-C-10-D-3]
MNCITETFRYIARKGKGLLFGWSFRNRWKRLFGNGLFFLSVSRYNRKIADIIRVTPIYCENRRYNSSCADIFEKSPI